jgi:hypothetical protein
MWYFGISSVYKYMTPLIFLNKLWPLVLLKKTSVIVYFVMICLSLTVVWVWLEILLLQINILNKTSDQSFEKKINDVIYLWMKVVCCSGIMDLWFNKPIRYLKFKQAIGKLFNIIFLLSFSTNNVPFITYYLHCPQARSITSLIWLKFYMARLKQSIRTRQATSTFYFQNYRQCSLKHATYNVNTWSSTRGTRNLKLGYELIRIKALGVQ